MRNALAHWALNAKRALRAPGAGALRAIVGVGAIQALTLAFHLLRGKALALGVGPEGVGLISILDQVVSVVAQVSAFSLPFAALKALSAAHSEPGEAFARTTVAFFRVLLVITGVGTALALAVVAAYPAVLGPEVGGHVILVLLALCAIPATALSALITSALAAAQRTSAAALFGLLGTGAVSLLSVAGLFFAGLNGFYAGSLAAAVLGCIGGGEYLRRMQRLSFFDPTVKSLADVRRYPSALSLAATNLIVTFTTPWAFLVVRYAVLDQGGLEAAGWLQAAIGLALALATVMRAANALFLTPQLNRQTTAQAKQRAASAFARSLSLTLAAVALPLVLFPEWWLWLIYSARFLPAAAFVGWFVLAESIGLIAGISQALLVGLDDIRFHAAIVVAGHGIIAGGAVLLVPVVGISGVGAALLANALWLLVMAEWRLRTRHGGIDVQRPAEWLPLVTVGTIAIASALAASLPGNAPLCLLVKGGMMIVAGGLIVRAAWRTGVTLPVPIQTSARSAEQRVPEPANGSAPAIIDRIRV